MSFNVGGKVVDAIYVSGDSKTIVMAGNGTTADEEWPIANNLAYTFDFAIPNEEKRFPISGFDGRTSSASQYNPGLVIGGTYRPLTNPDHTHHVRLINQQFSGHKLIMETVIANQLFSLALPSCLVLSSTLSSDQLLVLDFGSNGVRLYPVSGNTIQTQYRTEVLTPIATGDRLRVEWVWDWINIYVNDQLIRAIYEPYFSLAFRSVFGYMYVGVGVYSGPNSVWSTPIGKLTVSGSTTSGLELTAQAHFTRGTVFAASTWSEVARIQVNGSGQATVQLVAVAWTSTTSSSTRNWRVKVNGTVVGTITDQNGTNLTVNNVTIPLDAVITVEGFSNSTQAANRTVGSGIVRVLG